MTAVPTKVVMLADGSVEIYVRPISPIPREELAQLEEQIMRGEVDVASLTREAEFWWLDEFGVERRGAKILSMAPSPGYLSVREARPLGRALWWGLPKSTHWIVHYAPGGYPKTQQEAEEETRWSAQRMNTELRYRDPRPVPFMEPLTLRLRATLHDLVGLHWGPRILVETGASVGPTPTKPR